MFALVQPHDPNSGLLRAFTMVLLFHMMYMVLESVDISKLMRWVGCLARILFFSPQVRTVQLHLLCSTTSNQGHAATSTWFLYAIDHQLALQKVHVRERKKMKTRRAQKRRQPGIRMQIPTYISCVLVVYCRIFWAVFSNTNRFFPSPLTPLPTEPLNLHLLQCTLSVVLVALPPCWSLRR